MYKLIGSAKNCDVLSIGFERDRNKRKQALTSNKNQRGIVYIRSFSKDIFGFAEHQEKATYGLEYKLKKNRKY